MHHVRESRRAHSNTTVRSVAYQRGPWAPTSRGECPVRQRAAALRRGREQRARDLALAWPTRSRRRKSSTAPCVPAASWRSRSWMAATSARSILRHCASRCSRSSLESESQKPNTWPCWASIHRCRTLSADSSAMFCRVCGECVAVWERAGLDDGSEGTVPQVGRSERQQEQEEEEARVALSASVCSCPPPRSSLLLSCLSPAVCVPGSWSCLLATPSISVHHRHHLVFQSYRVPVFFFVCACVLIVPRHHPPTNGRQQQPPTTTDRVLRSYYSCRMPVLRVSQSRCRWRHVQRQEARQHDLRHHLLPPMPRPTGRSMRPMRHHLVRRPRRDRSQPSHHSRG